MVLAESRKEDSHSRVEVEFHSLVQEESRNQVLEDSHSDAHNRVEVEFHSRVLEDSHGRVLEGFHSPALDSHERPKPS